MRRDDDDWIGEAAVGIVFALVAGGLFLLKAAVTVVVRAHSKYPHNPALGLLVILWGLALLTALAVWRVASADSLAIGVATVASIVWVGLTSVVEMTLDQRPSEPPPDDMTSYLGRWWDE